MMGTLINFPNPGEAGYDGLLCSCGSAWFNATIVIDREGHVFGYKMPLICQGCGAEHAG